jgi:hypothetical protein
MPSHQYDPSAKMPEVASGDSWGDPEDDLRNQTIRPATLPQKRQRVDHSANDDPAAKGILIEPSPTSVFVLDPQDRLLIREISSEITRLVPEDEPANKVVRQYTFREKPAVLSPKEISIQREEGWGRVSKNTKKWVIGIGLTTFALVTFSLLSLPKLNSKNAPRLEAKSGAYVVEDNNDRLDNKTLKNWQNRKTEVLSTFSYYARATTLDELFPLVVENSASREALRDHWQPLDLPDNYFPSKDLPWNTVLLDGQLVGLLEGTFPNGSPFEAYFVNQGDRLKIDWKATSVFGTANFKQLRDGIGDGSEIRGTITNSSFYTAIWPEADFQSYCLTYPGVEISIWCYARRGDASFQALAPVFSKGLIIDNSSNSQNVTLNLVRGASSALPNQWLIREILHLNWLTY